MRWNRLYIVDNQLRYGNKNINLTRNEFLLISSLLNSGGEVNCDVLKRTIWPERENTITCNNINQLSSRVKSKLIIAGCDVTISKNGELISLLINNKLKFNKVIVFEHLLAMMLLLSHFYIYH